MNANKYINADLIRHSLCNTAQITFEVTDSCNLSCEYCAYGKLYSDYDQRENKMMPIKFATNIIDYMIELWESNHNSFNDNLHISFYGGEPTLNMNFIEKIVDYIKSRHIKKHCTFNMTTNGILLDRYMDYFVANDFVLLISLDGNKDANAYRKRNDGTESFEKVISNIDKLQKQYPDYFKNKVNFNSVLHNKNSIDSIYSFIKGRYDKIPHIGDVNDIGIREEMKDHFLHIYRNSYESFAGNDDYGMIEKDMFLKSPTYHSATLFLMNNSDFKYDNYNELLYGKKRKKIIPSGTCIPFSKKIFVTVNGKILPCERIGHQFYLGTVDDNGVNLDFEAISVKYNEYYSKIELKCKKCKNYKNCIQCIFNLENIDKQDCVCNGFMDDETYKQYVNTQLLFFAKHPEAYSEIMKNVNYK